MESFRRRLGAFIAGGHDFIEAGGHEGELADWTMEFRKGLATVSAGDTVIARDMRFTVADVGQAG